MTELTDLHNRAMVALRDFYEAASDEETKWTGWGEQVVPPHAEWRRVKAAQAVAALRDAQPWVCSICGNKRCPHATDHDLACTGSNETGQEGSQYQ
jgi:hypothetical protein